MFYVKVLGAQATATVYEALGPVKAGKSILWQSPHDLDFDAWRKTIPYGFDRLDTQAIYLDQNADDAADPDGLHADGPDETGEPFWQIKWAVFPYQDIEDERFVWLGVATRRPIYILGENGKTLDRV